MVNGYFPGTKKISKKQTKYLHLIKKIFIPLSYITKNIRSWKKQPIFRPTGRCASQTAPEAQRKRNIRNAENNYKPLKKEDMKTKIILWIGALLLLMVGAGCEKEDQESSIEGKWSLIKKQGGFSEEKTFEINEVLCIFNSKGLVEVKTTLSPAPFLSKGTYKYSLTSEKVIIINGKSYEFSINQHQLRLIDNAVSDGDIFEFRKI